MPATGIGDALERGVVGLYRLRRQRAMDLLYVGEGKIRDRIRAHLKKAALPDHPQAQAFADPEGVEVSFVIRPDLLRHHRLEIENDMIGAHVLEFDRAPGGQFLG